MQYKVGDEVLVKGEITSVENISKCPNPYEVTFSNNAYSSVCVSEERIVQDKTYTQGLADSWNLLKKVYDMKCETIERIFDVEGGFWNVIRDFTYEEALAKIEAYEKEKSEIKVGDVVNIFHNGSNGVVVRINKSGGFNVVLENGLFYADCVRGDLVKTGKHIDIESLLRQIGE